MYDQLISKNITYFGKDGVIMYSKHCDYYDINPITIEDIKMFYDLLKSNETLPRNVLRHPQLSWRSGIRRTHCLRFAENQENVNDGSRCWRNSTEVGTLGCAFALSRLH